MTTCEDCHYYSGSEYLVCANHPAGPQEIPCPDFQQLADEPEWNLPVQPEEQWLPQVAFYDGDPIYPPLKHLINAEKLQILMTHPVFTRLCPQCRYEFQGDPPVHWDCPQCGWVDDLV
jgi:hypothetical protein